MNRQRFKLNDRVIIHSTGSEDLDGRHATVLGIAVDHVVCIYIIAPDDYPLPNWPWQAITMTESCLRLLV